MPLRSFHGGRALKRWRYVGLFGEQLMACVAIVQVGPARQSFWALYERRERRLRQRTRLLPRRAALRLSPGLPRRRSAELDALAVIDDTAGYHARHTEWWWAAGVGEATDGRAAAWNLVRGVNDPPTGSERAVWVGGEPHEPPPVSFTADLSSISCEDGSSLDFHAEAERSRRENLLIVKSDYRAPFGTFSGTLPGGIPLASGLGVCEHHRARW